MDKQDLFKNIPHEIFEGDVKKSGRLSSAQVHAFADKLLKQGFDRIKKEYCSES